MFAGRLTGGVKVDPAAVVFTNVDVKVLDVEIWIEKYAAPIISSQSKTGVRSDVGKNPVGEERVGTRSAMRKERTSDQPEY